MRERLKFRSFPPDVISLLELGITLLALSCCPIQADSGESRGVVNLTVEQKIICAERGETVYINCYLNICNANVSYNAWSLSWQEGRDFEKHLGRSRLRKANETRTIRNSSMLTVTSGLSVYANWSGVAERVFTCVAEYRKAEVHSPQTHNESSLVRIKPWPITNISFRFSETAGGEMIVETFWKSLELSPVVYVLKYCITPEDDIMDDVGPLCPHYGSAKGECRFCETRDNYYTAAWNLGSTPLLYQAHRVYVASQNMGCETNGKKHEFCVYFYPGQSSYCPTANKFEMLYLIPQPVIHVNVLATNGRNVQVFWSDLPNIQKSGSRNYIVLYNCSTNVVDYKTKKKSISLYGDRDFHPYRPYARCEFCVRARIRNSDLLSKSVCKTVRLHEEIPSGSPSFGCFGNKCETESDGIERNVTVTWVLPEEEEWNGVLQNVTISLMYMNCTQIVHNCTQVSDSNLTKQATVLTRLAINSSYLIKIVACNKEGCSSPGNSMEIPSLPPAPPITLPPTWSAAAAGENSITRKLAIVIGFLVVVAIAFSGFVLWFFMKRWKARISSLPAVSEPCDYDSAEGLPEQADVIYSNIEVAVMPVIAVNSS